MAALSTTAEMARKQAVSNEARAFEARARLENKVLALEAAAAHAEPSISAATRLGDEADATAIALLGDFNSFPTDGAYVALTRGMGAAHAAHPDGGCGRLALPAGATLSSAYAAVHGREPLFTRKKDSLASQFTLDYILVGARRCWPRLSNEVRAI